MLSRPIQHRRARRADFEMVWTLLTGSGRAVPGEPDRATLRRFRRVVADLGSDLYVAEADGRPLGLVHVVYTRRLPGAPEARLELLVVAPEARGDDVARELAAFAAARARRRGCAAMRCAAPEVGDAAAVLEHLGWQRIGDVFEFDLAGRAQ
jgi:GNAT superfamily N-acetyltransferase